ncbi:uncharacterized protein LOC128253460 [Drosophila gunungcola]|uniref:Uncharacterized protein n=1 Tax=Drosophila gunungcola TaxID=103775 RepID=A0A9Q0BNK1_9MUSC|nr:uncharacterized protein LOC128253460 [Drosophila gunungcola]KAI8038029.1 hypothetical protein M5D96_009070 [Drosophila gunungcola]
MTSLACVFIAGLTHLVDLLAPSSKNPTIPGPQLPTLIVAIAAMDLIWDNCFIPQRLNVLPTVVKRIYELAVAFLLLEIAIHVLWKTMEQICFLLVKIGLLATGLVSESIYEKYEVFWVGSVTVPLALLILAFAGQATDHFHMLHESLIEKRTRVELRADEALKYLEKCPRAIKRGYATAFRL